MDKAFGTRALCQLGGPEVVSYFIRLLDHENPMFRLEGAKGLYEYRNHHDILLSESVKDSVASEYISYAEFLFTKGNARYQRPDWRRQVRQNLFPQ